MMGSVEKAPRFPISVDVLSIEAMAGARVSCFIIVAAEALEGPRDAEDISDARLFRPEAFSSRSGGNMAPRSDRRLYRYRGRRRGGTWCS
jgi:hypothetical protein